MGGTPLVSITSPQLFHFKALPYNSNHSTEAECATGAAWMKKTFVWEILIAQFQGSNRGATDQAISPEKGNDAGMGSF